jgi:hypothetical protein
MFVQSHQTRITVQYLLCVSELAGKRDQWAPWVRCIMRIIPMVGPCFFYNLSMVSRRHLRRFVGVTKFAFDPPRSVHTFGHNNS